MGPEVVSEPDSRCAEGESGSETRPEAAVLDWYGPEADPRYWQEGKGGRTPVSMWGRSGRK